MMTLITNRGSMKFNKQQFDNAFNEAITLNAKFEYDQQQMVNQRICVQTAFLKIANVSERYTAASSLVMMNSYSEVPASEQPATEKNGKDEHVSEEETKSSPIVLETAELSLESAKSSPKVMQMRQTRVSANADASASHPSKPTDAQKKYRQRVNKFYRDQVARVGVKVPQTIVSYFAGTVGNIEWKTAVQKSNVGLIQLYRANGTTKFNVIHGIVVADQQTNEYFVIEESRIFRSVPCQLGAYICDMLTGPMKLDGQCSQTLQVLVRWKREYSFVSLAQIEPILHRCETRSRNPPNRLRADQIGKLTCVGMTTKITKPAVVRIGTCPSGAIKMYRKYFTNANGDKSSKYTFMNDLVSRGQLWRAVALARENEGPPRKGKAEHADNMLLHTLVFEIISNKRSSPVEPDAVVTCMRLHELSRAEDTRKVQVRKVQVRKVCKSDGCDTLSHYAGKGFCFKHSKSRKLCNICKKSEGRCSGGICRGCLRRMYSKEDLRQARMCVVCKCRKSREIGGRCKACMSEDSMSRKRGHHVISKV